MYWPVGWVLPGCGRSWRGHTGTCGFGAARTAFSHGDVFPYSSHPVQRGEGMKAMIKDRMSPVLLERAAFRGSESGRESRPGILGGRGAERLHSLPRPWPSRGARPCTRCRAPRPGAHSPWRNLLAVSGLQPSKVKVGQDLHEKTGWKTLLPVLLACSLRKERKLIPRRKRPRESRPGKPLRTLDVACGPSALPSPSV